ncbi:MAG: NUDIX domain-containing protein [Spirochaetes bacterium]|nr:NUDIX domain-containing protein [Spirochaetota bacterium]
MSFNRETDPTVHYRFCPRCASPGSFDNTSHSFRCPGCGFHFYLNSAAAVSALIFNGNGELLVVTRGVDPSRGKLDLPGGFVDPGESLEAALLREIGEELHLTPDSCRYYASFANRYPFTGTVVYTTDCVFRCSVADFTGMMHGDDIAGIEFIKLEEIDIAAFAFESVRNILSRLIDERKNVRQSIVP